MHTFFLSGVFEFIIILDPLVRLTLLKTAIVLLDNCKILKYVDLRTLLQIASIIWIFLTAVSLKALILVHIL